MVDYQTSEVPHVKMGTLPEKVITEKKTVKSMHLLQRSESKNFSTILASDFYHLLIGILDAFFSYSSSTLEFFFHGTHHNKLINVRLKA